MAAQKIIPENKWELKIKEGKKGDGISVSLTIY
jgi:hypothetical protein